MPFGSSELASPESESGPLKRSVKIESGIGIEGTRSRFEGASSTGAAVDDEKVASRQLRGSRMSTTRDWMTSGSSSTRRRGVVAVDRRTLRETRNGAVVAGRDLCTGERTTLWSVMAAGAAAGTGRAETVCESSARATARTQAERQSGKVEEEYMIAVDLGAE